MNAAESSNTHPERLESPLAIAAVEPFILRIPLETAVKTPMGMVDSAIALLVQVRLKTGETGWGEVWCNFPRYGAYHRAVVIKRTIEPFVTSREFAGPAEAWAAMHQAANVLRLQSGENGPVSAAIAGVDIALWDIVGKRLQQPLWKLLGGQQGEVGTYASLGRSHGFESLVEDGLKRGFRGFKLRCWGDSAEHIEAYVKARKMIGSDMELMADCNSSWPLDKAAAWSQRFEPLRLSFIEEPIPVDSPVEAWQELSRQAPTRLAGGENMLTESMFDSALASGAFGVLQPDVCKWGGISGGLPMVRRIVKAGLRYCPHIFSGAPGLLASGHLLAAANTKDGLLEYGIEYNPPRDDFVKQPLRDGRLLLGDTPGLGADVDLERLARYRVATPDF